MPSERVQRQLDRLLDEAEQAFARQDWSKLEHLAKQALALDRESDDAQAFAKAASEMLGGTSSTKTDELLASEPLPAQAVPSSFAGGRYQVKKFLGEGGKKKVYLAHDTLLDRDIAFALIKTEGLDDVSRERIAREAQAMGRLGAHPHIVTVFDLGEEAGQPYMVTELMGGGDVEGVIEKAPDHKLPLDKALAIAAQVCRGLEFAHGRQIVHRDLKPGNVWLTADGVAKIGDFGLAVAIDKTRLTQAGMMVGTVNYMPPEQATGGEVTSRSDLYSLGAMLYEMVTGRPPFVGDEAVAILGQHLNTPPVSPSWHNPDCPPGLEALILRLLEKDPNRRPESAKAVREALESVAQAMGSKQSAIREQQEPAQDLLSATSDNPLYRRAFVGRETELRELHAAFDAALSGQGSLVMVVGEPGIGKTAVCEQLATYTALRGGKTLTGHCYEEGSLSLPYLPFVEAMRSYVLDREPEGLKSDLGSGAGEVARIVSEIRDRVHVEPVEEGDAEEQRWRLLQAVSGFLRNASQVQPLLIVLEDLHDADRGTLDLLVHMARNLEGARLILVGTYRDVEVDRSHPLSSALAELRRGQNFLRVPLRGLTAEEVQRMMASVSQQDVPWPMAEVVHRQTEGNPLFVQEMLRYLVEEGLVERREGALRRVGDETLVGRIPEGLRDVIGKRLARLSLECNRLLAAASVIGRDFSLSTLTIIAGRPREELSEALEEAVRTAVLTEQERVGEVLYRFAHAFFRQTLYEELGAARRIQIHQQVARALESQYDGRLSEHAAELAEHFAHSSDHADLAKAVRYAKAAAERAMSVYAYGEAVRHLEQALDVQEVLDPDDKLKRCGLLLALGEALNLSGDPVRVFDAVAPEAADLGEQMGDKHRSFRACAQALDAIRLAGGVRSQEGDFYTQWASRAQRYAEPGTLEQVSTDLFMSRNDFYSDRNHAWQLVQRALALARDLANPEAQYECVAEILGAAWPFKYAPERLVIANEYASRPANGVSLRASARVFGAACNTFLMWGQREEAERALAISSDLAQETRDPAIKVSALARRVQISVLDGQLEQAIADADALRMQGEEAGVDGPARDWRGWLRFWPLIYLGRGEQALREAAEDQQNAVSVSSGRVLPHRSGSGARLSLSLAVCGRRSEGKNIIGQGRRDWSHESSTSLPIWLAAATAVGDLEATGDLRRILAPAANLIAQIYPTVIARHLGAASVLLGEPKEGRVYYDQAIEVSEKVRHRPEMALARLELAELLLENYLDERETALGHLNFAIGEFREMKMQPSLERALRHKEVLKA
jgi:hypothetical protein